jgi:3-isopropylmalate/(R)-2-methylmalate dehydratase small subunit
MSAMNWVYAGRCWKFGDNLGIDGDIMPLRFALERETDPMVLRDHLMNAIDPDFVKKVSPGDIIVAGQRFGQGNPHIQGFLGIRGHQLGLVVESTPRGSFRNAVNAGVPMLSGCKGVTSQCETGDQLRVDFETGRFENLTRGTQIDFEPLPKELRDIIAIGGWKEHFRRRLTALSQ